jgi:4-hydroxybenzoate polyprenyltransferase
MCLEKFNKKMSEMHKDPINCFLHLVAAIIVICALWQHNIMWILIGILVAVVGHIIQEARKKKGKKVKKRKRKK